MASNQQSLKDPIETLIVLAEKFQEELSYHNRFDVDLMLIWKSIAEICVKNLEFGVSSQIFQKIVE